MVALSPVSNVREQRFAENVLFFVWCNMMVVVHLLLWCSVVLEGGSIHSVETQTIVGLCHTCTSWSGRVV